VEGLWGLPARHTLQTSAATRALGVHPETVRRYVKEGKLPATKVRGRWRFIPQDVALFKRFGPPSARVGHSTINMTMRYAHLAPGGGAALIRALESPAVGNHVATGRSLSGISMQIPRLRL
jgi:excisionase family DNA binding protein